MGYTPPRVTRRRVAPPFDTISRETQAMKTSSAVRAALVALTAFAGAALPSVALADDGSVSLVIYKAGWIIGGSGGGGVLNFHGRRYPLSTGGVRHGPAVGRSQTVPRR